MILTLWLIFIFPEFYIEDHSIYQICCEDRIKLNGFTLKLPFSRKGQNCLDNHI